MNSGVNGTFVTEIDGVEFYTGGIRHGGTFFTASIAYIDFSREYDSISDTGAWTIGVSTDFPVANVDNEGQVTVDFVPGVFDAGLIRYADGTYGFLSGASIGGPLAGISFGIHGGGMSPGPYKGLSKYDHIEVYSDGTVANVRYSPGNADYPHVKVTRTTRRPDGSTDTVYTNIEDPVLAADMAAGQAPKIYHGDAYWGRSECFLAGTMVDMWPIDPSIRPGPNGKYNRQDVLAKVWQKPIEEISPADWVLSFDKDKDLVPGKVTRTFSNDAKIILDFHGTFVTPGHIYFRPDSRKAKKFEPLIDILRDDGMIQHKDGTLIRASTGCEVGSADDEEFWAFLIYVDDHGHERVRDKTKLRYGTRWMDDIGRHFSMRTYLEAIGVEIVKDGPLKGYARWKETGITSLFTWVLSDTLPKPEDFVLARSGTTLGAIYQAGQWESLHPSMPAPMVLDRGPVQPLSAESLNGMPRNEPLAFQFGTPSSEFQLAGQPKPNRLQRKAVEAKARRDARNTRSRRTTFH